MDLVSSCKMKLSYFRIKELKDVLTQLGVSKQGKKQDLMDRILGMVGDGQVSSNSCIAKKNPIAKEAVVKIIDDAYRKMQISDASDLATKPHSSVDVDHVTCVKEEIVEDFVSSGMRICCPCGSSMPTEFMIQCIDPMCQVQQHAACVIILDKPADNNTQIPARFYCELCRIKRADPFWVTVSHYILPAKLALSHVPIDGTNPLQSVEGTFQLTRSDQDLLQSPEYDLQAWSMLFNDGVLFRMHWPQYADLQVNGLAVRTVNRPGSQLLGANGRDNGALIKLYIKDGTNKISLVGCDSRIFCFGIRLVKRRTVEQVLNLIPKEKDGELFGDALARVCRCIGGGMGCTNDDSDSDLEVIADSITVNLRCPMSGSRMKIAGRFRACIHLGCFDLETFVELNQRSRKWQCPICLKNYCLEDLIIDPYFNRITTMMRHCGEDVTEIEVKPDGTWSAKNKSEVGDLGRWHFPDGSLCVATNVVTSQFESLRPTKKGNSQEAHDSSEFGTSETILPGIMQVSKHQLTNNSSKNHPEENFVSNSQMVITMSSSATSGGGRDEEDPSINQDYGGHVDISPSSINEINSMCLDPALGSNNLISAPGGNTDIIILSDSDEENAYDTSQINDHGSYLAAHPGMAGSYLHDSTLEAGLGLFNSNVNDIGVPNWSYPSGNQVAPGFQLFGTDSDVSDAFINLESSPITGSAPMNGYTLSPTTNITSGGLVLDSSACDTNIDTNIDTDVGLVDNPLAFVREDPSLQNFLPVQLPQQDIQHQPPVSNGVSSEDWISLRLCSNGVTCSDDLSAHAQPIARNGVHLGNPLGPNEATSVATPSDDAKTKRKTNKKFSDGPFSFPRQPRSVRHRVCPAVD